MNDPLPLYEGSVPCVQSGFCCRRSPCAFGEWDEEKQQCKYLEDQTDGTALCGRYEEILELPVVMKKIRSTVSKYDPKPDSDTWKGTT